MFRIVCDPSSGSTELCLTELTLSGSQIFFVCLIQLSQSVVPCTHTPQVQNYSAIHRPNTRKISVNH